MTEAKAKTERPDYYVWFDAEFTGLELEEARLLQVAVLVTDTRLQRVAPLSEDRCVAVRLPEGVAVSPWVEEHLGAVVRAARGPEAVAVADLDAQLAALVERLTGAAAEAPERRPVLAGNSIHNDWWLARKWLPGFLARLSYRHLDVTTLKLLWLARGGTPFDKNDPALVRRYFPAAAGLEGRAQHDALFDVCGSVAELAFYREALLNAERGMRNAGCGTRNAASEPRGDA